jgi:hypothetical protein
MLKGGRGRRWIHPIPLRAIWGMTYPHFSRGGFTRQNSVFLDLTPTLGQPCLAAQVFSLHPLHPNPGPTPKVCTVSIRLWIIACPDPPPPPPLLPTGRRPAISNDRIIVCFIDHGHSSVARWWMMWEGTHPLALGAGTLHTRRTRDAFSWSYSVYHLTSPCSMTMEPRGWALLSQICNPIPSFSPLSILGFLPIAHTSGGPLPKLEVQRSSVWLRYPRRCVTNACRLQGPWTSLLNALYTLPAGFCLSLSHGRYLGYILGQMYCLSPGEAAPSPVPFLGDPLGTGQVFKCAQVLFSPKPVPRETSALGIPEPPCLSTWVQFTFESQKWEKGSHRKIRDISFHPSGSWWTSGWRKWVSRTGGGGKGEKERGGCHLMPCHLITLLKLKVGVHLPAPWWSGEAAWLALAI